MDCDKVENCSVVRRIKIQSSFQKTGMPYHPDKDNPSCYCLLLALISEGCISDGMEMHECVWHGQLTHLERHHQVCSPDLSPIENFWCIIHRNTWQRRPKTVEQLEACIRQEWDNILSTTSLHSPQTFADCFKRKSGCHTVVNVSLSQLFWDV